MKSIDYMQYAADFAVVALVIALTAVAFFIIRYLFKKHNKIKYTGISNKVADAKEKYNKTGKW